MTRDDSPRGLKDGSRFVRKVQKTHRYLVTEQGRQVIAAILAARKSSTKKHVENTA